MEPIRVLQISYEMNRGGAETLIMNLYRNIDRSLVQFDFLLSCPEGSAYEEEIRQLGGRIYRIPRFMGYNKISYDRNLTRFLKEHPEHHILHNHLMNSAAETLKVAKRLGRVAVAHSHIADVPLSPKVMMKRFFSRKLWKIADYRFACAKEAGLWLYRGKADFIVLNNGIDTARFKFDESIREKVRAEFGIGPKTRLIGTVGRMDPQKNQLRLLDIFRKTLEIQPDCKLMIIGIGDLESEIRAKIAADGLSDKVILTGARSDVNELLMGFDVFAFPSIYEGLGIVLVEAQASGLHCVFTDTIPKEVDLVPELLHRTSLSEPDAVWADRIVSVCGRKQDREACWRLIADKGYDIKSSAKRIQDFYLEVDKGNAAHGS